MSNEITTSTIKTPSKFSDIVRMPIIEEKFNVIFRDLSKTNSFLTSVVSLVNNSSVLKNCEPSTILGAAMVAASLKFPVNPALGLIHFVPYGNKCQAILGYKAFIQLALRSGMYATIHTETVYEDELEYYNAVTGEIIFTDIKYHTQRINEQDDKIIGYYAKFSLLNGFNKEMYMVKSKVEQHAKRYSRGYHSKKNTNLWKTDFDIMALKTVIKRLLSKWGALSTEMEKAIEVDNATSTIDGNITYDDNPEYVDIKIVETNDTIDDILNEELDQSNE